MQVVPSGRVLGAAIEGLDLAGSLEERQVEAIVEALGRYGVVRFPRQRLSAQQQKAFAARFGDDGAHLVVRQRVRRVGLAHDAGEELVLSRRQFGRTGLQCKEAALI